MEKRTRRVDSKARTTLFQDFAGATVTIERIHQHELRIRRVRSTRRKYTLKELVAGITRRNRHPAVQTGKAVGAEAW